MNAMLLLELTKRYTEPHRFYHNLIHISTMLKIAGEHKLELTPNQQLAIWLHDVIYDPRSKTNEEDSCIFATEWLKTDEVSDADLKIICQIIMSTKTHRALIPEAAEVCDLDLASFVYENVFDDKSVKITKEYTWFIGFDDFRKGRIEFLEKMLQASWFFYHDKFRLHYDAVLKQSWAGELKRLKY